MAEMFIVSDFVYDPHPIEALAARGALIQVAAPGHAIPMAEAVRRGLVKVEEPEPAPEPVKVEDPEPVTAEVRPAPKKRGRPPMPRDEKGRIIRKVSNDG